MPGDPPENRNRIGNDWRHFGIDLILPKGKTGEVYNMRRSATSPKLCTKPLAGIWPTIGGGAWSVQNYSG